MAKSHRYTEKDLETLGLVLNADGTWSKPKVESPFMRQQRAINEGMDNIPRHNLTVKTINEQIPNLELKTEWFISGYSVPSKKNSRQNFVKNGKMISIPSKQHAEYKKMTNLQYVAFAKEFKNAIKVLGLEYPLRVQFTFIRSTKHRFDYCNACQTCEDIMTETGWWEDDSADHVIPVFAPYEYDKNNAGVRIRLLK